MRMGYRGPRTTHRVNVAVPADFVGICFMRYPMANAGAAGNDPRGLVNWGTMRMTQMYGTRWSDIETAPGVYDAAALAAVDSVITFQRSLGKTIYFGVYGTPRFYASTAPNPTYSDYDTIGPWNGYGEGAHPTSLAALAAFVAMIVTRYNAPGGAWFDQYGAALGKGIQMWEPLNEPEGFYKPAGNENSTGVGTKTTRFGWHTPAQIVDNCATQFAAAKAVDPSIKFTSPGFTGAEPAYIGQWLSLVGPVTGKAGFELCQDGISVHPYNHVPIGMGRWNAHSSPMDWGSSGIGRLRKALAAAGHPNIPIYAGEWGVDSNNLSATMAAYYGGSAAARKAHLTRCLASFAVQGVKAVNMWTWAQNSNTDGCTGNLQGDTDGAQAAVNDVALHIAGKTITEYEVEHGVGIRRVVTSDGGALDIAA